MLKRYLTKAGPNLTDSACGEITNCARAPVNPRDLLRLQRREIDSPKGIIDEISISDSEFGKRRVQRMQGRTPKKLSNVENPTN